MPYESVAQQHWAHTPEGTKALGGKAKVKEWDRATDYSHLPERKTVNKGYLSKTDSFAKGGSVLGRSRSFLKESDGADQKATGDVIYKNPDLADQSYGKDDGDDDDGHGKSGGAPKARKDKSLPTVKPRG